MMEVSKVEARTVKEVGTPTLRHHKLGHMNKKVVSNPYLKTVMVVSNPCVLRK